MSWVQLLLLVSAGIATQAKVCHEPLGCFETNSPWFSLKRPVPPPGSPEKVNTMFYLYTRKAPARFVVTIRPEISLEGSDFAASRRTFIFTHGWLSNGDIEVYDELKEAILKHVDANVFITDWAGGANDLNYLKAVANTRIVGAEGARLFNYLIDTKGLKRADIHIMGHSLGAQIAGYMGKGINPKVGRITGLDPASYLFQGCSPDVKLDKSDAVFVDAIHSDGRPFIPLSGLGMSESVGHVDFYLNGGCHQPGCTELKPGETTAMVFGEKLMCSHVRALVVWMESILNRDCKLWGHSADYKLLQQTMKVNAKDGVHTGAKEDCTAATCVPMGLDTPKYPARGVFAITTGDARPFCKQEPVCDGAMKSVGG